MAHFDVNIDLHSDSDDDDPLPIPEPPPDTESEPEPTPEPTPPPTPPPPPPPPEHWAWLPFDKDKTEPALPTPTRISDPCDIYVDSVRFLPDNIRFCKVTGRVINLHMSKEETVPDVFALPVFESSQRCPSFRYKLTLNKERVFLNPRMVIMFRVYGYQKHTREVVIVGACLISPFDYVLAKPALRVGGHQLRLRNGHPNLVGGLEEMEETDMDKNHFIPGMSLCVRFLPTSEEFVPAPLYESGYYRSESCRPTETDRRLFRHYVYSPDYSSNTVGDELRANQREEGEPELTNGIYHEKYLKEHLDQKALQAKTKKPVSDVDFKRFVTYDISHGLNVCILGMFGLPVYQEGYYTHVYCEVLTGKDAISQISSPEGYGHDQRFITRRLDFLSSQRSPQFKEIHTKLHPHIDERSVLLLQVFEIQISYTPGNGKSPGTLKGRDYQPITIQYEKPLCWGIMQLFDKGSAIAGLHWIPLLKGAPSLEVLSMLYRASPAYKVLLLANRKGLLKPCDGASMEIRLWDGHLEQGDLPERLIDDQIETLGPVDKLEKFRNYMFPNSIDDIVLENMEENVKKDGPVGERFEKERDFFEHEANQAFMKAMNDALTAAGKSALP